MDIASRPLAILWAEFENKAMPGSETAMRSGESETPTDLHRRACRLRRFAREMALDADAALLTALADELDARAEMMESTTRPPPKS